MEKKLNRKYLYGWKPNILYKKSHGHHVNECVFCGEEENVTILPDRDICHECGYVYT